MGARINYIFDDGTNSLVVLYSHWGESNWEQDIQEAMNYALPRKGDYSYYTRMVISYLIQDSVLDETGYGIFAISRDQIDTLDNWARNVVIDLVNDRYFESELLSYLSDSITK